MADWGPKKCERCGVTFWKGDRYNTVVLVLLIIFALPLGVIYYLLRRKQRCPRCGAKEWHSASEAEIAAARASGQVIGGFEGMPGQPPHMQAAPVNVMPQTSFAQPAINPMPSPMPGQSMTAPHSQGFCGSCGAPVAAGMAYCAKCGAPRPPSA